MILVLRHDELMDWRGVVGTVFCTLTYPVPEWSDYEESSSPEKWLAVGCGFDCHLSAEGELLDTFPSSFGSFNDLMIDGH